MTWTRIGRTAAVLAAAAGMGGCASAQGSRAAESAVSLIVENQNWQDARIYVAGTGPRLRLGTVSSMRIGRMEIPRHAWETGSFRLEVQLVGSFGGYRSEPIVASAGNQVRWSIRNSLSLSSLSVR